MTSIIAYRNPMEQWFWEGGYAYVGSVVLVLAVLYFGFIWNEERKAKAERKERWLAMNETQRRAWRYFRRTNGFEADEWEKESSK